MPTAPRAAPRTGGRTVYLETFGCQMNELDSELVAGQLASLGYRFTPDSDTADVVLYNTCSVREQAEQKVWSRLGALREEKRARPTMVVGVLGCMAERDGADLIRRMPVVDILCGPGELDKLPGLLDNAVRTRESLESESISETARERESETGLRDRSVRVGDGLVSANQVALQGGSSRRSATLAAAEDTLELLDLSRSISPIDVGTSETADGDDEHGSASGSAARIRRSAYVRITRGCNKHCTYCVVPFTRGAEIHRPPDHIVDECKRLADAGVIEVTLLGQTVNHYRFEHGSAVLVHGITQPQKGRAYTPPKAGSPRRDPFAGSSTTTFADLLARIHDEVPAIQRLRFVTSYPRDFGDDALQVMRDCPRICRYLHVPAQSGSDSQLRAMNRGYSVSEYEDFLARARDTLHQPEIGRPLMVSGDFIVGFPGETDADYDATVALVERARYKNCFIFKYSPRPGTPAFDRLEDDVPEDVKRRRNNHLLAVQQRISDEISAEQVGLEFNVMAEGVSRRAQKQSGATAATIRKQQSIAGGVLLTVSGREPRAHARDASSRPPRAGEVPAGLCGAGGGGNTSDDALLSVRSGLPVQFSARTDGDLIVFFDAPHAAADQLIGTIQRVRITRADRLNLHATLL